MTFYSIVWYFFIYAFFGWCAEVAFAAARSGKFVNRGFLNGPVCPIYGFGLIIIILALTPLSKNLLLLFAGSMLLTSALELATGWALEKIFHTRWWDYSNNKFNVHGYICLGASIVWGLAAVFVMEIIQPLIAALVRSIPRPVGIAGICVFSVLILSDLAATVAAIHKMQKNLRLLTALAGEIHEVSDKIGEGISGKAISVKEQVEDTADRYSDITEMKKAHRAEEQSLAEKNRAEEQALLETILAQEKVRLTEEYEAKSEEQKVKLEALRGELGEKLSFVSRRYKRILKAFPDMTSRDYQEALDQLKKDQKK